MSSIDEKYLNDAILEVFVYKDAVGLKWYKTRAHLKIISVNSIH